MGWFSSNSNSNSFLGSFSIKVILVDSSVNFWSNLLIWLHILPILMLTLNFSLSRLILIYSQPSCILFYFFSLLYFLFVCLYVPFHQFLLLVCNQKGRDQFFWLKKKKYCSIIFTPVNYYYYYCHWFSFRHY